MIIGYARVSTDDQSLGLQLAALERFGVDRIITEKASGKTVDRATFQNMLHYGVRPGDTLVVWKLDRMGRTLSGVIQVIEDMQKNGVDLVSITDGFDVRTPMGKAMMQISLVFAELERNMISERTKAGMAAAKAAGKTFGPKHSIMGFPKRLKLVKAMDADGQLRDGDGQLLISRADLIAALNAADKSAKPIKSAMTIKRWQDDGFPGLDPEPGK